MQDTPIETKEISQNRIYHIPVMLEEAITCLNIKPGGIYVDCTFGGGGHSKAILSQLDESGRLIAFDRDSDAARNIIEDSRLTFINENFSSLAAFLRMNKVSKIDGVLADLGVSSYQIDSENRGFSIRYDGTIDMRMDMRQKMMAKDVLMQYDEASLWKMFEIYGEISNAKTLAQRIVEMRLQLPLQTIHQLKSAISKVVLGDPRKYFAQVFQALRIEVNKELEALKDLLVVLPSVMKEGGRAVVITFHSLEEKIVKSYFQHGHISAENNENEKEASPWRKYSKKAIVPTELEQKNNPRSRSAKLRWAEA